MKTNPHIWRVITLILLVHQIENALINDLTQSTSTNRSDHIHQQNILSQVDRNGNNTQVRVDLHGSRDGKGRINITGDTGDMGVNNRKENNQGLKSNARQNGEDQKEIGNKISIGNISNNNSVKNSINKFRQKLTKAINDPSITQVPTTPPLTNSTSTTNSTPPSSLQQQKQKTTTTTFNKKQPKIANFGSRSRQTYTDIFKTSSNNNNKRNSQMSIFGSIGDIGDIVRKTSKAGFNVNFNMNVGFNRNNMAGTVGGGRDRNQRESFMEDQVELQQNIVENNEENQQQTQQFLEYSQQQVTNQQSNQNQQPPQQQQPQPQQQTEQQQPQQYTQYTFQDQQPEPQPQPQPQTQSETDPQSNFLQFNNEYSKKYQEQQLSFRHGMFVDNYNRIKRHNMQRSSYELSQNQFADLSIDQFHEKYLMQDPPQLPAIEAPPMAAPPDFQIVAVDWRQNMAPAKHQGKCGSCWAFSVIGVMETMYRIQKQQEIQMSVQHLVDCCKTGCNGCRGGWPVSALQYVAKGGITFQEEYPYTSAVQKCKNGVNTVKFLQRKNPYSVIDDVASLAFALETSPVSVIVDASKWDPLYKSGVFDQCSQQDVSYNHAVICVGIDEQGNWIVRNSWGVKWGDQGHIYLPAGNSCGIADMGVIPNFKHYNLGLGMAPPI